MRGSGKRGWVFVRVSGCAFVCECVTSGTVSECECACS